METKRLYRSRDDRKVGGVAAGIANYFDIDPLLIRLLFVIFTLAGGSGVLIYIILWIVTPEQPLFFSTPKQPFTNDPESNPEPASGSNEQYQSSNNSNTESGNNNSDQSLDIKPRKNGSLTGGLVLITIGGLFLADELIPEFNFWDFWPVILIVLGGGLLLKGFSKRGSEK